MNLDGGENDARSYCAYSDSVPLNPPNQYAGTSHRFYGGVLLLKFNGSFSQRWAEIWSGSAIAPNDKLYYGADTYTATSDRNTVGYDFRFWKKEDFLNSGSSNNVTFSPTSQLEILQYEGGGGVPANNWGRVRFVVRDGTQFYVSEDFGGPSASVASFTLTDPASRRWAPYSPSAPYNIQFNASSAVFETRSFSDVTAVGYYHSNDNSTDPNRRAGFTAARFRVSAQMSSAIPAPTPPTNLRILRP